jgi:hypothetical protein
MFTREAPKETPEDNERVLKKAKFEDFTYVERNGALNNSYLDFN